MSHTPVCRACGYTITFPDDAPSQVEVCPRCNHPLTSSKSTFTGTMLLGIVGVLLAMLCLVGVSCPTHLNGKEDESAARRAVAAAAG